MSYHLYHTRAFVLGGLPHGESNRLFYLFTEDFGLVFAVAQAVRETKSKLRYSLPDFSFARVTLVRGREIWRVTDAEEIKHTRIEEDALRARIIAGLFLLMRRFVHGEERDPELFEILSECFSILEEKELPPPARKNIEALSVLRLLNCLGYMQEEPTLHPFVQEKMTPDLLLRFEAVRSRALPLIREGMKGSQL